MSFAPAMKDTTGFLVPLDVMNSAACSSAVPPISPIMMMPSVCSAAHAKESGSVRRHAAMLAVLTACHRTNSRQPDTQLSTCGSFTKRSRQSTKLVPLKGSPPMPTTVDCPSPTAVVWKTACHSHMQVSDQPLSGARSPIDQ